MRSVITISRQIGSQGDEVAERLAAKLGMQYFDKKLLGEQARKLGISIYEAEACAIIRSIKSYWRARNSA